jgi:hypothetical protein
MDQSKIRQIGRVLFARWSMRVTVPRWQRNMPPHDLQRFRPARAKKLKRELPGFWPRSGATKIWRSSAPDHIIQHTIRCFVDAVEVENIRNNLIDFWRMCHDPLGDFLAGKLLNIIFEMASTEGRMGAGCGRSLAGRNTKKA